GVQNRIILNSPEIGVSELRLNRNKDEFRIVSDIHSPNEPVNQRFNAEKYNPIGTIKASPMMVKQVLKTNLVKKS
ncbi:MAG: hypothetical protein WCO51_07435, partial [bacterium]